MPQKIMKEWIKGSVKLSADFIRYISLYLSYIKQFIPDDFSRTTRTRNDFSHYKATEFRLHMLYIIPVAFNDFLPSLIYHHFLYFHGAMKLLVNPQLCKQCAKYANQLLIKFIRDSIKIYCKKFVVYNVHNLVHLPEDVLEFGCVDNFSAFPFENFLQNSNICSSIAGNLLNKLFDVIMN